METVKRYIVMISPLDHSRSLSHRILFFSYGDSFFYTHETAHTYMYLCVFFFFHEKTGIDVYEVTITVVPTILLTFIPLTREIDIPRLHPENSNPHFRYRVCLGR